MKRIIVRNVRMLAIASLLIGALAFTSCSSKENKCRICGKELNDSNRVKATAATGEDVYVCNQCYVVGKQFGKCF